jgi:hypothetical protein
MRTPIAVNLTTIAEVAVIAYVLATSTAPPILVYLAYIMLALLGVRATLGNTS